MSCKRKNSFILILAVVCCMALLIPFVSASASDNYTFSMEAGAQARVDFTTSETPNVENAIRFVSTIEKGAIDDNDGAKVVTIITLTDYLDEAGLNSKEGFTLANLVDNEVKYQTVEFSKSIGNLIENGNNYVMKACLYNIKEANIAEEMSAVSYLDLGNGPVQYTEYTYNGEDQTGDHASSLWEIANEYKDDVDYEEYKTEFEELAAEYTLTVQSFEDSSVTKEVTIRRGESLEDIKDKVNAVVAVDGVAYFNGTAQKDGQPYAPEYISSNETLEIGYNALAFTLIEGLNDEEITHCGSKYAVSSGTLTAEDTLVVKVPATFKGTDVVRLGSLDGKAFTHVILPESVSEIYGSFADMGELRYVSMPGVSELSEYYHGDDGNRAGTNAFINCNNLEYLILGKSFKATAQYFATQSTDAADQGKMNVYMLNSGDTFEAGHNANLYSGNVYYYSDNATVCGSWGYETDGVTIIKNNSEHDTGLDGKCTVCGVYEDYGVIYSFDTDHYVISGYTGTDGNLKVLDKYDDGINGEYPVTGVVAGAFEANNAITKVILPESVTTIGSRAFANCINLEYVSMIGVNELKSENFVWTDALETLIIGTSLSVSDHVFTREVDKGLTVLVYGTSGSLSIDTGTHAEDRNYFNPIKSAPVYYYNEDGVTRGTWKYTDESQTDFVIAPYDGPAAYDDLGVIYTFDKDHYIVSGADAGVSEVVVLAEYCDGVNGVYPVTTVKEEAFNENTTITKVILPESVTTLGKLAFRECTSLTYVSMIGVKELGHAAEVFNWCDSLDTLIVGTEFTVGELNFRSNTTNKVKLLVKGSSCTLTIKTTADQASYNALIDGSSVYYYDEDGTTQGTWKYVDGVATINN